LSGSIIRVNLLITIRTYPLYFDRISQLSSLPEFCVKRPEVLGKKSQQPGF
jgi:hypothetical protein